MKLLAIEAQQYGAYYLPRYRQVDEYGGNLHLLQGVGEPDYWPAPRYRVIDSAEVKDIVAAALDWHAEQDFDGVLTFSESSVTTVALVAEALGLPSIGLEAALNSRNKLRMRQAHERGGVPHPRFRFVTDLQAALDAAAEFGYPVVLKPTLGAASFFVFRVDSPQELEQRYQDAAEGIDGIVTYQLEPEGVDCGPHGLLVESFLDGREYLFEAVIWDDEVFLGSIVDRATVEGATFDDDVHVAPTTLTGDQLAEIKQVITAAALAHGLHRSVMHAEIRFHRDKPYLVEIAVRPGGGGLDMVARVTAGYCPILATMDVARGIRPQVGDYRPTGVHMMGTCLICQAGELEYVSVPAEVSESDRTLLARITAHPGAIIQRPPDGNNILGFLVVTGDSADEVKQTLEDYASKIEVKLVGQPATMTDTPWSDSRSRDLASSIAPSS
ncbi:MAG TPA: ATP-grasp domain-containing protein [Jatrophihabitans sp.]|jgi:biotin carboxylase|uniref:ATP-grasp domain-containing protein n=1 Tax=Jatrophihabitans sp. TaxID=1932789 RepID=UPI002F01A600